MASRYRVAREPLLGFWQRDADEGSREEYKETESFLSSRERLFTRAGEETVSPLSHQMPL